MVDQFTVEPEHHRLATAGVRPYADFRVETGVAAAAHGTARPLDDDDDP
ncbi:hypothetical protein GCM10020254_62490 [Streptomyces goshikiensis]